MSTDPARLDAVLAAPMDPMDNDAGATTVRAYLIKLLTCVWEDGESFNGKRPFGNSGWQYEVYAALIKAGIIKGILDEDGDIENVDYRAADDLVGEAIERL
jgi:hypothetical protein